MKAFFQKSMCILSLLAGALLLLGMEGCSNKNTCESKPKKSSTDNESSKKEKNKKQKMKNEKKDKKEKKEKKDRSKKIVDDYEHDDLAFLDSLNTEKSMKAQEEIAKLIAMIEEENKSLGKEQEGAEQPYQTVLFEPGVTHLDSTQYTLVAANTKKIAAAVKSGKTVIIRGHSDALESNFSEVEAITLAKKRAEAIKNEFVKAGIPESTVEVAALGNAEPIVYNFDRDQEELSLPNRRVEIITI